MTRLIALALALIVLLAAVAFWVGTKDEPAVEVALPDTPATQGAADTATAAANSAADAAADAAALSTDAATEAAGAAEGAGVRPAGDAAREAEAAAEAAAVAADAAAQAAAEANATSDAEASAAASFAAAAATQAAAQAAGIAAVAAGETARIERALTPEGFDAEIARDLISKSNLGEDQKRALIALIGRAQADPALVEAALDDIRAALN